MPRLSLVRETRGKHLFNAGATGILAVLLLLAIGYRWSIDAQFDSTSAASAIGTIESLEYRSEHGGSYNLSLHFSDDRQRYHSVQGSVGTAMGGQLHIGGPIPVKYLRDDPLRYRIDLPGEEHDDGVYMLVFMAGTLGIICLFSCWRAGQLASDNGSARGLDGGVL